MRGGAMVAQVTCKTMMAPEKVDESRIPQAPSEKVTTEKEITVKIRTTSFSTACSGESGSELTALDELIAEKLGKALEAISRAGDAVIGPEDVGTAFENGSKQVPSISVRSYLRRMLKYIDFGGGSQDWESLSPGVRALIAALIYIDRIVQKVPLAVNSLRIHRLVSAGMLVALKVHEDAMVDMRFFSALAGVSFQEMKQLERTFLKLIDWDLVISEQDFVAHVSKWKRLINASSPKSG